jgi:hypothetical protein
MPEEDAANRDLPARRRASACDEPLSGQTRIVEANVTVISICMGSLALRVAV